MDEVSEDDESEGKVDTNFERKVVKKKGNKRMKELEKKSKSKDSLYSTEEGRVRLSEKERDSSESDNLVGVRKCSDS